MSRGPPTRAPPVTPPGSTCTDSTLAWWEKDRGPNAGSRLDRGLYLSLDCTAAFNAAPLDPIIERLETIGFPEARGVFNWFGADGTFRRQRLSKRENWETTTSGVRQGSVLGPILWLSSWSSTAE